MPNIELQIQVGEVNKSLQIGDTAYYVATTTSGGFTTASGDIVEIGPVTSFSVQGSTTIITCTIGVNTPPPPASSFILFSKDNKANANGVLGYYAEAKFSNNSTAKAELFSVASEMFESSK